MSKRTLIKLYSTCNLLLNSSPKVKILEPKCNLYFKRNIRGIPNVKKELTSMPDLVLTNSSDISSHHEEIPLPLSAIPDGEYLDTIAPPLPKSFNLAAYANKSETLQKLIKMGVNLNRVEKLGYGQLYAQLDFEKDVKNAIIFLNSIGVDPKDLGYVVTRNPTIFQESIANLETKITYFQRKKFSRDDIARIINRAPEILRFSVKEIDSSLGFLQREFKLNGNETRLVAVTQPKLLINRFFRTKEISFVVKEELGFSEDETKQLLFKCPKIWLLSRRVLSERLDYIHNEMGISHAEIASFPRCLLRRKFLVNQRHRYLQTLHRAQYDKTKPNYVSLRDIATESDKHFCENIAKTSVQDFNAFLKTL